MSQTSVTLPYTLATDEKAAQVMVYTLNNLYWGEVVVKSMIRVSTWLRTNTAPDRLTLFNAHVMNLIASAPSKPLTVTSLNIAVSQLQAFHLVPPARDPLDFDPTEPNRMMEPVSLLVGNFRIDGMLRLSSKSSLAKYLEVTRESFTGVYDAKITNVVMTGMGAISVPFLLVRQESAVFMKP